MKKLFLSSVAVTALTVGPALAADLAVKAPRYVPPPAPLLTWTGFYAGLGIGFRSSRTDLTTTSLSIAGVPQPLTGDATSEPLDGIAFRAAPYVGFNWQVAPQWVVGIEGDFGFASQTTTLGGFPSTPPFVEAVSADSLAVKTNWDASARARVGFLVTPATLIYATGGAAWQRYEVTSTCLGSSCTSNNFVPFVITNSATKLGWTAGGGIETSLGGNWLARADYRYSDYGTSAFVLNRANGGPGSPIIENFDVKLRTHIATFGLAYKFGDPVSAPSLAALPVKAIPAAVLWDGIYVGAGVGLRSSRTDITGTSLTLAGVPFSLAGFALTEPLNGTAFRGAPYVGWNWQVAPQWVVGIEGDFGFASQTTTLPGFEFTTPAIFNEQSPADSLAVRTRWDASARARIGFLVTPATLIYATGGAAWQRYDVTSTCASFSAVASACTGPGPGNNNFSPAVITNSATKLGWTVGGGLETNVGGNWFARADYRYADFGTSAFTLSRSSTNVNLNPVVNTFDVSLRTHTAMFGLAYKFDWGGSVVARY